MSVVASPADLTVCSQCNEPHGGRCKAHRKSDGRPCRRWPMTGQGICYKHGANASQNLVAAERRQVTAEADGMLRRLLHDTTAPPVTNPIGKLQEIVGVMGGVVEQLGVQVNELNGLDYTDRLDVRRLHVVIEVWERFTTEYRRALTDMVRLGIEERAQALEEAKAMLLVRVIEGVLGDLDLSPGQRALVSSVVPRWLRTVMGEGGAG